MKINTFEAFCREYDYQKEFTYEERIDLFNRFGIDHMQKYFSPLYTIASFILTDTPNNAGYSHGGNVLTALNQVKFEDGKYIGKYKDEWTEIYLVKSSKDNRLFKCRFSNSLLEFCLYDTGKIQIKWKSYNSWRNTVTIEPSKLQSFIDYFITN